MTCTCQSLEKIFQEAQSGEIDPESDRKRQIWTDNFKKRPIETETD